MNLLFENSLSDTIIADDVKVDSNSLDTEEKGWLIDVLDCVNAIPSIEFSLEDVYSFEMELSKKHMNNHYIQAKIRQQLQFLRDRGYIEFLGKGQYRKLYK